MLSRPRSDLIAVTATWMQVWVVDIGVGRFKQLLGSLTLVEKPWCCERCRAAAQAAGHGQGERQGSRTTLPANDRPA